MNRYTLLYALPLVLLYSCTRREPAAQPPRVVRLAEVRSHSDVEALVLPGRVVPRTEATLAFRVSGTLVELPVREGDHVRAGQLLARLDETDYRNQLTATEAEHEAARLDVDRILALYSDGAATERERDRALSLMKQLDAKLANHRDQLTHTRLVAPTDGCITRIFPDNHLTVAAGMPVLTIVDQRNLEVEVAFAARDVVELADFASAEATFDVFPGATYPLQIGTVASAANANQQYTARLALRPTQLPEPAVGMACQVRVSKLEGETPLLRVPSAAVRDNRVLVFSPLDSTVHERRVEVVRLLPAGDVVVLAPMLSAGERVVNGGTQSLSEGQRVSPLPQSLSNVGGLL